MRSAWFRLLGHAVVVLAAALKYYPVTLLILAWRERWPRCVMNIVLALACQCRLKSPQKCRLKIPHFVA
jgi:hypothetical protein